MIATPRRVLRACIPLCRDRALAGWRGSCVLAPAADMLVVAEGLAQALLEIGALAADIGQKAVAFDRLMHTEYRRAGEWMADIGLAVREAARTHLQRVHHRAPDQHRADWHVAGAQSLGDRHQIGRSPLLLAGMERAGAPSHRPQSGEGG